MSFPFSLALREEGCMAQTHLGTCLWSVQIVFDEMIAIMDRNTSGIEVKPTVVRTVVFMVVPFRGAHAQAPWPFLLDVLSRVQNNRTFH